jgi:hypothetical protein
MDAHDHNKTADMEEWSGVRSTQDSGGSGPEWVQRIPGFPAPGDWFVPAEERSNKARGSCRIPVCARLTVRALGNWDAK